ncbi:hypothetical protein ATANTOWER_025761 [Ataeniobius toweri]|uniref:Uncharacterized protein n=1 Tax=Ataeniobius toweri TaxID=208326 RepID=A0ABU7BA46_9TELE|nr:hypothetical protein [Ataeniobius toweri]
MASGLDPVLSAGAAATDFRETCFLQSLRTLQNRRPCPPSCGAGIVPLTATYEAGDKDSGRGGERRERRGYTLDKSPSKVPRNYFGFSCIQTLGFVYVITASFYTCAERAPKVAFTFGSSTSTFFQLLIVNCSEQHWGKNRPPRIGLQPVPDVYLFQVEGAPSREEDKVPHKDKPVRWHCCGFPNKVL